VYKQFAGKGYKHACCQACKKEQKFAALEPFDIQAVAGSMNTSTEQAGCMHGIQHAATCKPLFHKPRYDQFALHDNT
jgi:hypothetical protein